MARAGLGSSWRCLFANDFDKKKARSYQLNWGAEPLVVEDVANLTLSDVVGDADLAWASFPCQDLSLAGQFRGLAGRRSGTFWPFWNLIRDLIEANRGSPHDSPRERLWSFDVAFRPRLCSNCLGFQRSELRFWSDDDRCPLLGTPISAATFHCRHPKRSSPSRDPGRSTFRLWHSSSLRTPRAALRATERRRWIWWNLPRPAPRNQTLIEIIEEDPKDAFWNSSEESDYLISLIGDLHRKKLESVIELTKRTGIRLVGAAYRRTRDGRQRAEVRFDKIAGCLRTPIGGSSRQTLIFVEARIVRTRLLTPREAARLMGLPESYILPDQYNQAYHLCGDGVVVPVVRHLAAHILEPVWVANQSEQTFVARAA